MQDVLATCRDVTDANKSMPNSGSTLLTDSSSAFPCTGAIGCIPEAGRGGGCQQQKLWNSFPGEVQRVFMMYLRRMALQVWLCRILEPACKRFSRWGLGIC